MKLMKLIEFIRKELRGNNWLKILFDKGFRYFFTILVFRWLGYPIETLSPPLLTVALTMPVIDLIAFRVIDRVRTRKA